MRLNAGWQHKALAVALLLCSVVSVGHVVWAAQSHQTSLPQGWIYLVWSASAFFPDSANYGAFTPPTYELVGTAYLLFHILVLLLSVSTLLGQRQEGSKASKDKAIAAVVLLCGALSAARIAWIAQFRGIFEDTFQDMTWRQAWISLVWTAEAMFVGDDSGVSIPLSDYLGFAALCVFHILGVLLAVQNLRSGGEGARVSLSALIGEKGIGVG